MDALDANANARIDILEALWSKKHDQQQEEMHDRETVMEGAKSVNNQVRNAMSLIQATTIKEIVEKLDSLEVRLTQGGSISLSSRLGQLKVKASLYIKEIRLCLHIQGLKKDFPVFSREDPEEWIV
jgi:hypothetical protein